MNAVARVCALGLIAVLAALVILQGLAWKRWGGPRIGPESPVAVAAGEAAPGHGAETAGAGLRARAVLGMGFALGLVAFVLGAGLVASMAWPAEGGGRPREANHGARAEFGSLNSLARANLEQREALGEEQRRRASAEVNAEARQAMLDRAIAANERLGRDLHDGLIQSLYAGGLTLESALPLVERDPSKARERIEGTLELMRGAIRELRSYLAELGGPAQRQQGLLEVFRRNAEELRGGRPVEFAWFVDEGAAAHIAAGQVGDLLQVAREAMSNALRHGGATVISVRLHALEEEMAFAVEDNGCGFEPGAVSGLGHGLVNLRERATALGGQLQVTSTPGRGTRVVLTWPASRLP